MIDIHPAQKHTTALVILFLFAANLFFYSGRFHSIDEMALLSTTESMAKWQRVDINGLAWGQYLLRGPDQQGLFNDQGDLHAKKAPLVAWLALPLYALAGLVRVGQVQAALLLNALVVALTGGVVFRFSRRLGYTDGVSAWAALLFGLGTSALVYAKYLFTEPVSALGWIVAAEAVWRARCEPDARESHGRVLALGGAGLGAALLANPVNAVFAPLFVVTLLFPPLPKRWIQAAAALLWPLGLSILVMAAWNAARFGNPLVSGYHLGSGEGFSSPLRISLPGMLWSPARGFVWFVPAVFLALGGAIAFFRRHTRLAVLALTLIAGHVLVFSAWWMWWSGWGWGPRFLVPIMPLIALMALPTLDTARRDWIVRTAVIALMAVSIGVQALGAAVGFDEYENIMTQTHLRGDPEGDLYRYGLDVLWNWKLSPIIGHAELVRAGNTDLAWLPGGRIDWLMLVLLLGLVGLAGLALKSELGKPYPRPVWTRRPGWLAATSIASVGVAALVVGRADLHPLRATYGLDPLEGQDALSTIAHRAQPGDGTLLMRPLTPGEMDRFPGFPPAYGIPDESLFGAEWDAHLERLLENAEARQKRLWLVVKSEDDKFASQIITKLKEHRRRVDRIQAGGYVVLLFEPR